MKDMFDMLDMKEQKAQRVPNKMGIKRPIARYTIIKTPKLKDKERILNAAREKQLVTYRRVPIRLSADFSKETCRQLGTDKKCKKYSKS